MIFDYYKTSDSSTGGTNKIEIYQCCTSTCDAKDCTYLQVEDDRVIADRIEHFKWLRVLGAFVAWVMNPYDLQYYLVLLYWRLKGFLITKFSIFDNRPLMFWSGFG